MWTFVLQVSGITTLLKVAIYTLEILQMISVFARIVTKVIRNNVCLSEITNNLWYSVAAQI